MPSGSFLSSSLEQLKNWPVYDTLMFCASKNTDRIHVYTKVRHHVDSGNIPKASFFSCSNGDNFISSEMGSEFFSYLKLILRFLC